MTAAADRHLLFGLLALQNGLIDQGQLMLAFQAWTRDKSRSLAEHLEARGDLTAAKRAVLDALAEVHLEAHGGDVEKSLAAVPANHSTRASLAALGEVFVALDAELHREVALKQILERHADDPDSRHRFVAEAEITGGLEHPGVVPVYGALGSDLFSS
jgi:hypothetical protein